MELTDLPAAKLARLNPHLFSSPSQPLKAESEKRKAETICRERDLHDQIERLARARGWLVSHARMDRASTIAVGFPDFVIFQPNGRAVFLECKRPGGKATPEQLATLAHARKLGFVAEIVESLDAALAVLAPL